MRPYLFLVVLFSAVCALDSQAAAFNFITFEKPEHLYQLMYEAKQSGVISDTGVFYPKTFVEVAKTIPSLYQFCENQGIIVLGDQFSSAGLQKYVDSDLALHNMLTRCGILDSRGAFSQSGFVDVITRYDPITNTLAPPRAITQAEKEEEEEKKNSLGVSKPLANFNLSTVKDVYDLVLNAYMVGVFDKDGNFIESALLAFLKDEPTIHQLFRTNGFLTETTVDGKQTEAVSYGALTLFVENRPNLAKLLAEANVYKSGAYSTKGVSDIVFLYDAETGKLGDQPVLPPDQITRDENAQKEADTKAMDLSYGMHGLNLTQSVEKVLSEPVSYLRDFLVLLRKHAVFSTEGDFDAFALYKLIDTDKAVLSIANSKKIYVNTTFAADTLLKVVLSSKDLIAACETLGILIDKQYYSQDAVAAIVESYKSPYEENYTEPFSLLNPVSAKSTEDVMELIAYYYTLQVLDKNGLFDLTMLQNAMDKSESLRTNILSTGVLKENTVSVPMLRNTIIKYPLLRIALARLGIIDSIGDLDEVAFIRAIIRATNNLNTTATDGPKVKGNANLITSFRGKINRSTMETLTTPTKASKSFNYVPLVAVLGGLLLLAIIIVIVVFVLRRRSKNKKSEKYARV